MEILVEVELNQSIAKNPIDPYLSNQNPQSSSDQSSNQHLQNSNDPTPPEETKSEALFTPALHIQRRALILSILSDFTISTVFDIGCSDGVLLSILLNGSQFLRVAGLDIDPTACIESAAACQPTLYDLDNLKRQPCSAEIYQGGVLGVLNSKVVLLRRMSELWGMNASRRSR
jgi:hypothetical protein